MSPSQTPVRKAPFRPFAGMPYPNVTMLVRSGAWTPDMIKALQHIQTIVFSTDEGEVLYNKEADVIGLHIKDPSQEAIKLEPSLADIEEVWLIMRPGTNGGVH